MSVMASLDEQVHDERVFECPLFVPDHQHLPSSLASFDLNSMRNIQSPAAFQCNAPTGKRNARYDMPEKQPLLKVPVATNEDLVECHGQRVAMYSAPFWILPL